MEGEGSEIRSIKRRQRAAQERYTMFEDATSETLQAGRTDDACFEKKAYIAAAVFKKFGKDNDAIIYYNILVTDPDCPKAIKRRAAYDLAHLYIQKKNNQSVGLRYLQMSSDWGYLSAARKLNHFDANSTPYLIRTDQEDTLKYVFSFKRVLSAIFPNLENID